MFRRHDLLVIEPRAWAEALECQQPRHGSALLAGWAQRGWPVILRRRLPDEREDHLPVGVQLPLAEERRRIPLLVPHEAIVGRPARPDVAAAAPHAPAAWRSSMAQLAALPGLDGAARVFGSLLWQSLTGLTYLRDGSDLDLTFPCAGNPHDVAASIAPIDRSGRPRIDGELLLPDGGACQWREVLDGRSPDILVKTMQGVELRPRAAFGDAA